MNNKIYYLNTKNEYGQILVFTSYKAAADWCRSATRWSEERIKEEIKEANAYNTKHYSIFPDNKED